MRVKLRTQTKMNDNTMNTATPSSNEEPVLKWTAPRAPTSLRVNHYTDEELDTLLGEATVHLSRLEAYHVNDVQEFNKNTERFRLRKLTHETTMCEALSMCQSCATLKKTIKLSRKMPERDAEVWTTFYQLCSDMSDHTFQLRVTQDRMTFDAQTVQLRAFIVRRYTNNREKLTTHRRQMIRAYMVREDNKQHDIDRQKARDRKYASETDFEAQGLGPIEHARGDCTEMWSMCDDCCTCAKVFSISKMVHERAAAAHALYWRIVDRASREYTQHIVDSAKYWLQTTSYRGTREWLHYYYIYAPLFGPNFDCKVLLFELVNKRDAELEKQNKKHQFVAQARTLAVVEFAIPALDRITETLNNLITTNVVGVDPHIWARRLTSFVLMLMQLCAESSLFIKMTAVAQFLTHFHFPAMASLRGYAQQLAQVFQTAVERMRSREGQYNLGDHLTDDDEEEEEVHFHAQNDTDAPEGILSGTARLLCAMAGVTDYDVKANSRRVAKLDQISRTITSVERLSHYVERLFRYAFEMCSQHIFGVHPDMRELQLVSEKVPKWMTKVTNYYNAEGMVRVTKNIDEARAVQQWQREGDEYNALLWKFKTVPKAYAIFKTVYNQCDKMNQAAAPYLTDSAMRVTPFTIMLYGSPGLGKSATMYSLITDLMVPSFKRRGLTFVPGQQIHVRNSESKHWDGYNGQAVVIFDDVYQAMDAETTMQQSMDICHMKNIVSWPVTKADLASKGNTFMTSELLVMTGNAAIPNDVSQVIRSFEAIRRRIDMMVMQKVQPEYTNRSGRLDRDKLERDFPTTYVDGLPVSADITSVLRFDVYDNQNQRLLVDGTYEQLMYIARQMKDIERERDEAMIRANYVRAGLNIYGQPVEEKNEFHAQMFWNRKVEKADEYVGDLLFESDMAAVRALCNGLPTPGAEGLLTEEERIEIFAAITRDQPPDQTWSQRTVDIYTRVRCSVAGTAERFANALGDFVARTRTWIESHEMFRVGSMVLLAVGLVTTSYLVHRFLKRDEQCVAETSGDEKTRQTRTRMKLQTHETDAIAHRVVHGQTMVAIHTSPKSITWVPESSIGTRKPLKVRELLWTDPQTDLPKDVVKRNGEEYVAQACPDRNAYNLAVNRVTNNAVLVTARDGDRVVSELRGLFVFGRVLMMPHHFFYGLDIDNVSLELTNSHGQKMNFNTSECAIKIPPKEMDIVFLRLPKRFQCAIDLRAHFHTEESINKYVLNEAMLWVIDGTANTKMVSLCDNIKKDTVLEYRVSSYDAVHDDKQIHLVKSYVYNGLTLAGYCGAPLIWLNASVQGGHILGVHVAGTNLRGLTTPISRDFLMSYLSDWDDISIITPMLDHDSETMTAHAKRAVFKEMPLAHYGRVAAENQVRIPSRTTIKQSPLHGVFTPVTAPALLSPTREHNPLRMGILKQAVPLTVFPQHIVDQAVAHLANDILSQKSPYTVRRVLSVSEALNGVCGDPLIPPMNMHTSPGYPYVNSNVSRPGKFDFIEGCPGEWRLTSIVAEKLNKRLTDARNRTTDMTIFIDILKDERVKLDRIAAGKTRIFNVAPFDLNVAMRMYFQVFAAHVMHNHVYGECTVGINPHSDEWGLMLTHLTNNSQQFVAGDYSNYDKQLSYQVLRGVYEIIRRFYNDEHANVRETLFETMFSAFHIAERDVYRVAQGNPSGIVMTSLINSLANSIMMRVVYMELGGSLPDFHANVRLKTYGDDNIMTVSDEQRWFNMASISQKFKTHGVIYNRPDKAEITDGQDFLSVDDVTFLKRAFRVASGRTMAPLAQDSINEMINWIRNSNDDGEATRANFLAACREMYHYGREQFDTFCTTVYTFAHKISFPLPYTDYFTSGEYWGAENDSQVNLARKQTTHLRDHCSDLVNEEVLFSAQSKRAPRKTKAVWPLLCELLIIAVVLHSTPQTTNQTPNDDTTRPTTNSDNVTSRQEITTFSDTSVLTEVNPQNIPSVPPTPVDPYMKETLTAFLSRVYYYTIAWQPSQPMGTLLAQLTFPNFLLSVTPIWDKIKNFTYFRAGVKIGIRMNGSKFHYGQILVSWSPQFNNTMDLLSATNNIYTASGCPCFTVSPSENEVHEFTLPFALPYQYVPLFQLTGVEDPAYQFGVVNIYVLNPLSNTTTPTPVSFTVFANFVDIDVAGYAPVAYTQPTRVIKDQTSLPALLPTPPTPPSATLQPDPLPPYIGDATDPWIAQRGGNREQKQKSEKGIVGTIAESVASIAGFLVPIPEVGVVASGVAVAATGIATVANYFGWTNPPSLIAVKPIVGQYSNLVNTHGLAESQNLGIHPDACVSPSTQLLGGDGHEMTMLHIAQTPTLLAAGIGWAGSDLGSTTIWSTPVTPTADYFDIPNIVNFPTLLSHVTRSCLFWRGSLRYHVQVICSQMHVGRLRIFFVPYTNTIGLTADQLASTASTILDVEQQSSVSFTIPYLYNQPWCEVKGSGGNYKPIGVLRIAVLNTLNHPVVPVPSVYINVWVSAGPDFQLSRPSVQNLRVNTYLPPGPIETEFVAQGLTRDAIRAMPAPPLIPASGSREESICNADEFHHVKDLIMRPQYYDTTSSATQPQYSESIISPFNPVRRGISAASATSFRDYFRLIFRYSRGSHRISWQQTMQGTAGNWTDTQSFLANGYNYIIGATPGIQLPQFIKNPVAVTEPNALNWLADGAHYSQNKGMPQTAIIPYYSTIYGVPNAVWAGGTSPLLTWNNYGTMPMCRSYTRLGGSHLIAAGDDYELIFLVGAPAFNAT